MSRFWSPVVHGLSPYVPGEQPKADGVVKLNTNENPYPPSPRVREAIAARNGVAPDQVFVGNGSRNSGEIIRGQFRGHNT